MTASQFELHIIGKHIGLWLDTTGATMTDTARSASMSRHTLSRIRRGMTSPSFISLCSVAAALSTSERQYTDLFRDLTAARTSRLKQSAQQSVERTNQQLLPL